MNIIKKYLFRLNQGAEETYKIQIYKYVESLNLSKESKILDVGFGEGDLLKKIGKIVGSSNLYGIDKSVEGLKKAKAKKIKGYDIDISQEKWNEIEGNYFDLIISNQVIEHLFNVDNYLRNIYRALKPGGIAIIATENLAGWHNILSLLFGFQPFSMTNTCTIQSTIGNPLSILPQSKPNIYMVHRSIMSFQAQNDLFSLHRFKIIKIIGSVYYPFPNSWSELLCRIDIRHSVYLISCLAKNRK